MAGQSTLIIENGRLLQKELLKERVSEEEVRQLLRELSIDDISKIKRAYLESNGVISVFPADIGR